MKKKNSYILLSVVIVAGIVLDFVTKILFAEIFRDNVGVITIIPNFFEFTYVENTGAAFGMLSGSTVLLVIISIVFVIGFAIYDYFNHSTSLWYNWGMGMIISGAIGNFLDRIFLGYVRDFISIKLFTFVFNVADMLITLGIICFAIYFVFEAIAEYKQKKEKVKDDARDK